MVTEGSGHPYIFSMMSFAMSSSYQDQPLDLSLKNRERGSEDRVVETKLENDVQSKMRHLPFTKTSFDTSGVVKSSEQEVAKGSSLNSELQYFYPPPSTKAPLNRKRKQSQSEEAVKDIQSKTKENPLSKRIKTSSVWLPNQAPSVPKRNQKKKSKGVVNSALASINKMCDCRGCYQQHILQMRAGTWWGIV